MIKKIAAALIALLMLCSCGAKGTVSERTTAEFVRDMGLGINLGNTLDRNMV